MVYKPSASAHKDWPSCVFITSSHLQVHPASGPGVGHHHGVSRQLDIRPLGILLSFPRYLPTPHALWNVSNAIKQKEYQIPNLMALQSGSLVRWLSPLLPCNSGVRVSFMKTESGSDHKTNAMTKGRYLLDGNALGMTASEVRSLQAAQRSRIRPSPTAS